MVIAVCPCNESAVLATEQRLHLRLQSVRIACATLWPRTLCAAFGRRPVGGYGGAPQVCPVGAALRAEFDDSDSFWPLQAGGVRRRGAPAGRCSRRLLPARRLGRVEPGSQGLLPGRLAGPPPSTAHCSPAHRGAQGPAAHVGCQKAAPDRREWEMRALAGCEHCGFLATTHGPVHSSHACPECGKKLREVGLIEARDLARERRRAELFRAQAASRKLGERVASRPSV